MKDIVFTQKKTVESKLVITKDLFDKIINELHVDPKITFEEFYEEAIGNVHFGPWVEYDYIQEENQSGYDRDYYTDEEYYWESKAGLKRRHGHMYEVVKEYFKHHSPVFKTVTEDIKDETIDVPSRQIYYK